MKILKAYSSGFVTTLKRFRLIGLAYLFLLVPGLLVAFPFLSNFKSATAQFISPGKLLEGYDYTAFTELIDFYGDGIKSVLSQASWLIIFYILISVFVTGAILHILNDKKQKAKFMVFLRGGSKYFWRFFRLSVIFIILQVLIALIVYLPFSILVGNSFEHAATEKSTFFLFLPFGFIHLMLAVYLHLISNYTRFILVHENSRIVLRAIWNSIKFVSAKFFGTYGLAILLFIIPALLLVGYFKFSEQVEMTSGLLIFLVFLAQQFYIWLRIATRVWAYASQFDYYLVCKEWENVVNVKEESTVEPLASDQTEDSNQVSEVKKPVD